MICQCCGYPAALTPTGELYPLTIVGPKGKTATHEVCSLCTRLFYTGKWRTTRLKLREMRGWK